MPTQPNELVQHCKEKWAKISSLGCKADEVIQKTIILSHSCYRQIFTLFTAKSPIKTLSYECRCVQVETFVKHEKTGEN